LAGSHFKIWQFLNRALARRNQVWLVRGTLDKAAAARWDLSPSIYSGKAAQETAT
jgi:hypothetical protein